MIESVIVNEWKAQVRVQDIIGILADKFGSVPAELQAKLEATTALDVLHRWVILSARADSLDTFRRDAGV